MDNDHASASIKELPVYSWHNKQEGKEEYAKFNKEFSIHLKQLRYLLDPAAVTRRLGAAPAPNPPANAQLRKEWREDKIRYENRQIKIDSDFAEALSALERSFLFATPPRHIIDKTVEARPADVEEADWNYERKFRACWEALRAEYQPSTAVDLSQLREQIFALNDQVPGGFDTFRSEFHRLHAEIVATRVPNGIREEELNTIVREGIKNSTVWAFVGFDIYKANPDAPWSETFEAVSTFLTSFRQKGIDPYSEANNGPLVGYTPVAANSVTAASAATPNQSDRRSDFGKRPLHHPRDSGSKKQKTQNATSMSEISNTTQTRTQWSSSQQTSSRGNQRSEAKQDTKSPRKCTRCWASTAHGYRDCNESKCGCGKSLAIGQQICYNYDNHPPAMQFSDKIPHHLAALLDAYRSGRSSGGSASNTNTGHGGSKGKAGNAFSKGKKGTKALAASVAEELIRRGAGGQNLDSSA